MTVEVEMVNGFASAFVNVFVKLIRDLDSRQVLSKNDFADELQAVADVLKLKHQGEPRLDLILMGHLAKQLREPPVAWTPVVIRGGRDPDKS